jgi:ASC-1-like (ASCH) protein
MTNSKIIEMKLRHEPFEKIKKGVKKIELRLFDEKRQLINLDDTIVFSEIDNPNNTLKVKVIGLSRFRSFKDSLKCLNPIECGWEKVLDLELMEEQMLAYYSKDEELKYGVLGIHLELL